MTENPIILFDGDCALCNGALRWVIARDPDRRFQLASLASPIARRLLARRGLNPEELNSVVLLDNDTAYLRSDAALRVAAQLRWPWRWLGGLRVIPRPVRDWVYDLVARNRHRWFGRTVNCALPSPEVAARLLS